MRILQLANIDTDRVTGGGSSRIKALDDFVDSIGGERIVIQDTAWQSSRISRFKRPFELARQIAAHQPDLLVLRYPGFPFFWSVNGNRSLLRGLFFLRRLHSLKRQLGFCVATDILDLLRFPSPNPEMALRLSDRILAAFERSLFELSDEVWACSYSIGRHLAKTYQLDERKIRVVLNGNFRATAPTRDWPESSLGTGVRLFYAGDLAQGWRGIELMISAFFEGVRDREAVLVLCGANGDWLQRTYSDSRIVHLGVLAPGDVSEVGSKCHVGLIPQPEEGYYHLAFPTKLGLYLTLGLPVITTRAKEAADFVTDRGVGIVTSAADLAEAMNLVVMNPHVLDSCRERARAIGQRFYWDEIYSDAFEAFRTRFFSGKPAVVDTLQ